MISKTLSSDNQLRVRCPIFPAESKIAACFMVRDLFTRGDKPTQRQGCSCAIEAGKCPIDRLIKRMVQTGEDNYHSTEPTLRSFDNDLIEATGRVLVPDSVMRRHMLTQQEEKALVQANENARNFVSAKKSKPRAEARVLDFDGHVVDALRRIETETKDAIVEAAKSGDMAAAITAAAQES